MWSNFNQLINLFAPPCLLCGSLNNDVLQASAGACHACWQDLPNNVSACQICALPLDNLPATVHPICGQCLNHPPPWQACYCALLYLPPISALMHAFKDQQRTDCGRLLSRYLLCYLQGRAKAPALVLPDLLIPMPLHSQRLQQRGFNQAQLISAYLGKKLGIKSNHALCQRILNTDSQQGQKRGQRQRNLSRAFTAQAVPKGVKKVAIVDDVMTTGASVRALSKALQQANQQQLHIQVWCLARTLPPNSQLHL